MNSDYITKSDLPKTNIAIDNSSKTNFLTLKTKKTFLYIQKVFPEVLIPRHFNLEHHIYIEMDVSKYAIHIVLSQITLDHNFSIHMIHKNLNFS